jgi:hypothetical protein
MRNFGALALGGVAGIVILKLLATTLLPLLGLAFGLMATLVKVGLWIAVGYFVYTLVRGRRKESAEA